LDYTLRYDSRYTTLGSETAAPIIFVYERARKSLSNGPESREIQIFKVIRSSTDYNRVGYAAVTIRRLPDEQDRDA
jgi:hypothetical protein